MDRVEYRYIYNRKGKLNKDGKALIQLEAYQGRKRKYFSTGIYVAPKQWDDKKKIIKNHPQAQKLNWQLLQFMEQLQEFEMEMRKEHEYFSLSMFEILKQSEVYDFWKMFEEFLETENVGKERKIYIRRTIRYLKEFNSNLSFDNFTLKTIYDFDYFLRTKKQLHNNTVMQHHKVIKHFFNMMIKREVIKDTPYKNFDIKYERTERTFLTEDELKILEDLQKQDLKGKLPEILDMFLFSCYTGLRFSDIQKLSINHIQSENNLTVLRIKQQKTNKVVTIPISILFNGKAMQILEKYINTKTERIFPKSSNQDTNRQLKLLQTLSGLSKNLTFHVARHTFGTLLATYTHDPYLIKELMGHSDIKTSMIYIHLSNDIVNKRLKEINWTK